MNLEFLINFYIPIIVIVCFSVVYVIKSSLNFISNKYIPLIMCLLGLFLNIIINKDINANIVLAGMFSGLASTGLHQLFKNIRIKDN